MFQAQHPFVSRVLPSPNHRPRQPPESIRYIILHGTYMATAQAALRRLCSPAAQVSCHYVITRAGRIIQLVPEELVAWHAGVSSWQGLQGLNGYSLGIELVNTGHQPYTAAQYTALTQVLAALFQRYQLGPSATLAHSDIAPDRKTDPGSYFRWEGLVAAGLALPRPLA